ncbi:ATP-dependent zinc metalloprotease FtsH [Mesomycoplasma ovipneumoniae]|uniref:ATP-dependent zinc metalloprotease FtsH n=1 Tax=Mesomycoplasma ovipneumoniae TaxID=29562 RepID=UPI002964EA83|nr:ATP-dependent zinc metalloprotease FtsH [Mesomycoplasma ovipneumoniae]MDW2933329.1 ATP-dependent zinc metalloprotease FtsH [Mesomycoplasma ovipneumoniae]
MQVKQKKKPSVGWIVLLIILLAGISYLVYTQLQPSLTVKSLSHFEEQLIKNAKNTTDGNFFYSIIFDINAYRIRVVEANEGSKIIAYSVIANPAVITKFQSGAAELSPLIKNQLQNSNITTYSELVSLSVKTAPSNYTNPTEATKLLLNELYNLVGAQRPQDNIYLPSFTSADRPSTTILQYIFSLLPILLPAFIIAYIIYRANKNSQGGAGFFNPGKNQAIRIKSDKKYTDVAGNVEAKEEISEFIDYLKNPGRYSSAGAKIPRGILLGGPPGTGKTLLAKATAGEANVPFFFISASNFVELYVGVGAKRVRELFRDARNDSPAIIFIDELDAIGRSRGSGIGGGNDEREQTLNQLLVEMDGMVENTGLLVIAATNRTDVLDPALLRPGRFDRSIIVGLPDVREREEILRLHAKGKRISKNITLANIAKRTPGFSGAQLENVINEATLLSVREKTQVITSEQIDEAIDRVIGGPAKKNRVITEKERIMVAYHEAGHAVVGLKLRSGVKVQKITIVPRGNTGGYNLMLPEEEKYNSTKSELLATIAAFMGGRAAEEIKYGEQEISTGAGNDIEKATKIARKMVTELGMSSLGPIQYEQDQSSPFLGRDYIKNTSFSSKVGHEIDIEIRQIISNAYKQASETIKNNLDLLELIKDTLLEKETIVYEEIQQLAETLEPLPKSDPVQTSAVKPSDILSELLSVDPDPEDILDENLQQKSVQNSDQNSSVNLEQKLDENPEQISDQSSQENPELNSEQNPKENSKENSEEDSEEDSDVTPKQD